MSLVQGTAQAHRRLAVPQVGFVEPLGRRQGPGDNPFQQQASRHAPQQGGGSGNHSAAGQQPQGDFPLGRAQGGENLHRLPLAAHKEEGKQHQHRQGPSSAGQGDGQGGGPQGLQGLGGGGIALVI